jgi:hypothetical protein
MTIVKPSRLGLKLDAPEPGDIVTVCVKPRPKQSQSGYGGGGLLSLIGNTEDEAFSPQHYRMTTVWEVIATNGGQAVVKALNGYPADRREMWPIALHDWFEASELWAALNAAAGEGK